MPVYTVEIDGKLYDIEGDRPPTESEARSAIGSIPGAEPPAGAKAAPDSEGDSAPPTKGAVRRFLEPIGDAVKGLASLPGALGSLIPGDTDINPFAPTTAAAKAILVDPSLEQAGKASEALEQGHISEAIGHGAASALPIVGPAAAEIGETLGEGNVAGALGQSALLAAPAARGIKSISPTSMSALLRRRAAKRILDVMRPSKGAVAAAEDVADDLVMGLAQRQTAGGIGVGSLKTLSNRAKARAAAAGEEIEAFQSLDTPVNVKSIPESLRNEATALETTPPPRKVLEEVESKIVDEFGEPIMGVAEREIPGKPVTGHPALVNALRSEAKMIDDLAAQYPDELVPAGELFKQRAAVGRRVSKAYQQAPGEEAAAGMEAGKSSRQRITEILHNEVPASKIPDREYRVFRTAWKNFETHRRGALTNRGLKGLKDLLAGRAASAAMGAGAGLGFGPLGGVAGALGGVVLGESAYWGSLRASTYASLSKALNSGALDEAAEILQRTSAAYAMDKGVREREIHRKAQDALRSQAEGTLTP